MHPCYEESKGEQQDGGGFRVGHVGKMVGKSSEELAFDQGSGGTTFQAKGTVKLAALRQEQAWSRKTAREDRAA